MREQTSNGDRRRVQGSAAEQTEVQSGRQKIMTGLSRRRSRTIWRSLSAFLLLLPLCAVTGVAALAGPTQQEVWTTVDALVALRMAEGLQAPDLDRFDANGDGAVTWGDAQQILEWSVMGTRRPMGGVAVEYLVQTESEAVTIAEAAVAKEVPEMVGAQRSIQTFVATAGEVYDVTYEDTVEVQTDDGPFQYRRVVIVTVDRETGETSVAVSD